MAATHKPKVTCWFHEPTNSCTYVVEDTETKACVVIDPVLEYDHFKIKTGTETIDKVVTYINEHNLKLAYILETHCHADHMTAGPYVRAKFPGSKICIADAIHTVIDTFGPVLFGIPSATVISESSFDVFLKEGQSLPFGNLKVEVVATPGHTPACLTYHIGDALFVGDTLFMPDYGCARCDFPGGSAALFWDSIQKLFKFPDETRMFMCHDYFPPNGRKEYKWETTVKEQRESNVWLNQNTQKEEFVQKRQQRDKQLAPPKLILPSLQVNLRGGNLPKPEENGKSYLKLPLNYF